MSLPLIPENHIVVFNDRTIRRVFMDDLWWFSVIDVIQTLTDSTNPRDYWYKMKVRVKNEDDAELSTFCRQLKLESKDAQGFAENKSAARAGGRVAGSARKDLEKRSGKKVITAQNFRGLTQDDKKITTDE